jgi:hypothetical protein
MDRARYRQAMPGILPRTDEGDGAARRDQTAGLARYLGPPRGSSYIVTQYLS